jgi:hypothetical protein
MSEGLQLARTRSPTELAHSSTLRQHGARTARPALECIRLPTPTTLEAPASSKGRGISGASVMFPCAGRPCTEFSRSRCARSNQPAPASTGRARARVRAAHVGCADAGPALDRLRFPFPSTLAGNAESERTPNLKGREVSVAAAVDAPERIRGRDPRALRMRRSSPAQNRHARGQRDPSRQAQAGRLYDPRVHGRARRAIDGLRPADGAAGGGLRLGNLAARHA